MGRCVSARDVLWPGWFRLLLYGTMKIAFKIIKWVGNDASSCSDATMVFDPGRPTQVHEQIMGVYADWDAHLCQVILVYDPGGRNVGTGGGRLRKPALKTKEFSTMRRLSRWSQQHRIFDLGGRQAWLTAMNLRTRSISRGRIC